MKRLPVGYRIGDFEITGAFRDGYRGRDHDVGRDIAIHELSLDTPSLRRFQRDARALAALEHRNIGATYDLVIHEERAFLMVELVEGETLFERLQRGPLPLDEATAIAAQLIDGVEAARAHGVVHGGLSAKRIVVAEDSRVKIVGFGLVVEPSRDGDARALERLMAAMSIPDDVRRVLESDVRAERRTWTLARVARWVFAVLALVLAWTAYVTLRSGLSP